MPFSKECNIYIGQNLLVLPYYGYGWANENPKALTPTPTDEIGPDPFDLSVVELFYLEHDIVGAGGLIITKEHTMADCWCVFGLREVGEFNFSTQPGHCMVWINRTRPIVQPVREKALYEWVTIDKQYISLCGYGIVAEKSDWIRDLYERTFATRKLVMGKRP